MVLTVCTRLHVYMIWIAFYTFRTVLHRLNYQRASIKQDSSQFFKVMENTLLNTGTDSLKMTWIESLLRDNIIYINIAIMHRFTLNLKCGMLVVEHNFSFKGLMRKFSNEECEGELSRMLNHVKRYSLKSEQVIQGLVQLLFCLRLVGKKLMLKRVTKGYHFFQKEKRLDDLQPSNLSTMWTKLRYYSGGITTRIKKQTNNNKRK